MLSLRMMVMKAANTDHGTTRCSAVSSPRGSATACHDGDERSAGFSGRHQVMDLTDRYLLFSQFRPEVPIDPEQESQYE